MSNSRLRGRKPDSLKKKLRFWQSFQFAANKIALSISSQSVVTDPDGWPVISIVIITSSNVLPL